MTDTTYGQRLAQRLRAGCACCRSEDCASMCNPCRACRQADLAEREWPLPVSMKSAVGLAWLPPCGAPDRGIEWDENGITCTGPGWASTTIENPTADDLRDAILWLVGLT